MELKNAIYQRRSVFKFSDQPVNVEQMMSCFSLANMAPNHHLTQPWQFIYVGEQTKSMLADIYAQARALKKLGATDDKNFVQVYQQAQQKFLRTPAVVIVACRVDKDPMVAEEDYAATCCAIQNLLLALTDVGLGAQWSTHPMIRNKQVLSLLGLDQQQRIVAMIYIGYPQAIPPAPPRQEVSHFIRILD
jgi:nitroreductase